MLSPAKLMLVLREYFVLAVWCQVTCALMRTVELTVLSGIVSYFSSFIQIPPEQVSVFPPQDVNAQPQHVDPNPPQQQHQEVPVRDVNQQQQHQQQQQQQQQHQQQQQQQVGDLNPPPQQQQQQQPNLDANQQLIHEQQQQQQQQQQDALRQQQQQILQHQQQQEQLQQQQQPNVQVENGQAQHDQVKAKSFDSLPHFCMHRVWNVVTLCA